jgi:hypothetical protein
MRQQPYLKPNLHPTYALLSSLLIRLGATTTANGRLHHADTTRAKAATRHEHAVHLVFNIFADVIAANATNPANGVVGQLRCIV